MATSLPRSTPEEQGVSSPALLAMVDSLVANPELHSVMVVRHGRVVAEGWARPFAADRPHTLYSLSKSFTSTAVGFAVAEGLVGLDDRVVALLPDEAPADPDERLARMTVRHLLTMTSGHDPEPAVMDEAGGWVRRFLATPLVHEPGERMVYDTPATHTLSAIVQRVAGQHMLDYLRPRLLAPLGMTDLTTEVSPDGVDVGGVGISATTEDVAKLGLLYLQDGMWEGRRVLPEGWVAQAGAAQVPTGQWGDPDWRRGYGFQFWRSRYGFRADGAFGQFALVLPEQDAVVAITGAFADTQRTLDAVWEWVPSLEDAPLPPADEGRAALVDRLAGLRLDPPAGEAVTDAARRVSGRAIAFDDNPFGLVRAVLTVGDAADEIVVHRTGDRTLTLRPGHDEPTAQDVTNPLRPRHSPASLVSGTWTRPNRYVLTVRHVQTPHVWTVTADVLGDRVVVSPRVNVAFVPAVFPPVAGTLGA